MSEYRTVVVTSSDQPGCWIYRDPTLGKILIHFKLQKNCNEKIFAIAEPHTQRLDGATVANHNEDNRK